MKVLLLNGSPRKNGCTYTALNVVADALKAEGIETEVFQAGDPDMENVKAAAAKLKEDPEILCNLGMAYLNVGNFDDANYYIERAYELNPEDEVTVACKRELAKYI